MDGGTRKYMSHHLLFYIFLLLNRSFHARVYTYTSIYIPFYLFESSLTSAELLPVNTACFVDLRTSLLLCVVVIYFSF